MSPLLAHTTEELQAELTRRGGPDARRLAAERDFLRDAWTREIARDKETLVGTDGRVMGRERAGARARETVAAAFAEFRNANGGGGPSGPPGLRWTADRPKVPGFYWWRPGAGGMKPTVLSVPDVNTLHGTGIGGEWFGPVPEPGGADGREGGY